MCTRVRPKYSEESELGLTYEISLENSRGLGEDLGVMLVGNFQKQKTLKDTKRPLKRVKNGFHKNKTT